MSTYLYGMHDLCPKNVLAGKGWIVHAARLGHDPNDHGSIDVTDRQETVICRLQHGWGTEGTLPEEALLPSYIARVSNYAQASRGVHTWIAWNEPNHSQERPHGQSISPRYAAEAYLQIRDAIRSSPDHADDLVLAGAIAPWNLETGDWLAYMHETLVRIGQDADAIALHAYTHGAHPDLIFSDERRHGWLWHFRTYRQQIEEGVPEALRDRPFFITETDQGDDAWIDYNSGWVQNAYREIDDWNRAGNPQVRALVLYRWAFDQWQIQDKPGVLGDLHAAMEYDYTWDGDVPPPEGKDMLENPSFEGAWYNQTPDGNLVLPEHWRAEYLEGANPWFRPEIKPNEEYTTDGRYSIRAFAPADSRMNFGIWQEIEAEPGQWYRFSADVRLESNPPGELTGSVGIQPWGAGIFDRPMIWGEETRITLEWTRVEVIARAFSNKIRVVMGATNKYSTRNNTTWWDNAALELWECDGGTEPPPEPGECLFDWERFEALTEDVVHRATRYELDHTSLSPNE